MGSKHEKTGGPKSRDKLPLTWKKHIFVKLSYKYSLNNLKHRHFIIVCLVEFFLQKRQICLQLQYLTVSNV